MPSWGDILQELTATIPPQGGVPDVDGVRRKYLIELNALTGRPVLVYATDWFNKGGEAVSMSMQDMQGLMEVFSGFPGPDLDLILHSPGGSPEAAASVVRYIRSRFNDVRVFVPLAAMSAATMWALSANRIVMGKHSQLGPIDPQLLTPQGIIPARALIREFERAAQECKEDPARLSAWLPILQQYRPGLLEQCEDAEALARVLVADWLRTYMFNGLDDAAERADMIADFFADSSVHKSHALGIGRDVARAKGVIVDDLEDDPALQDAVLSVHHAVMHTFTLGPAKLIENHLGRAFVTTVAAPMAFPMPLAPVQPGVPAQPAPVAPDIPPA